MNDLFRFIAVRPPQSPPQARIFPLPVGGAFVGELLAARSDASPRMAMRAAAVKYASSAAFVNDAVAATGATGILEFARRVASDDPVDLESLEAIAKSTLGGSTGAFVERPEFAETRQRAQDSLVALKLASRAVPLADKGRLASDLVSLVLAADLIARVAAGDRAFNGAGVARRALQRTVQLPDPLLPMPAPPEAGDSRRVERDQALADLNKHAKALSDDLRATAVTIREIMTLDRVGQVEATPQVAGNDLQAPTSGPAPGLSARIFGALGLAAPTVGKVRSSPSDSQQNHRFALPPTSTEQLSARARQVLATIGVDPNQVPVSEVVARLDKHTRALSTRIVEETPPDQAYTMVGHRMMVTAPTWPGALPPRTPGPIFGDVAVTPSLPLGHGSVQPSGVADLLVVKNQIKQYEAGEVAHIENVLRGEHKSRRHRRLNRTEESFLTERETTNTEERDQQSTERFELQNEASRTIQEEASLKAGVALSGSYGPTVEFNTYADVAVSVSKQESTRHASNYAKDITARSASKLSERVREERARRTVQEVEETNRHGIDNSAGPDHVVGVYQWVDKVYEAQVYNYGLRMLFDIVVPEPAAFIVHAAQSKAAAARVLRVPPPFNYDPTVLWEGNYLHFARSYDVTEVKPPPPEYVIVSETYEGQVASGQTLMKSAKIALPEGYRALDGVLVHTGLASNVSNAVTDFAIGRHDYRMGFHSWQLAFTLDGEVGEVPIAFTCVSIASYALTLEIRCQRLDRHYASWQIETHAALLTGYLRKQSEYEQRLAELAVQQGVRIVGSNPAQNRRTERTEIKKSALSILTAQHFDLFGAVSSSSEGFPQVDMVEAEREGRYVRFFEQAFEWEQMMYLFYPYFWGRKSTWIEKVLAEDMDPQFAEFVKAGSARAVIPVRPGFEAATIHYLETGDIWEGGDVPDVASSLYVSIVDELKALQGAPGAEVPQGDPWDVRVPTTLVMLRKDSALPAWTKDAAGSWAPVPAAGA